MNQFKKFWSHIDGDAVSVMIAEYENRRFEDAEERQEDAVYDIIATEMEMEMGTFRLPKEYLYQDSLFCRFMEAIMDGDALKAVDIAHGLSA